MKFKLVCQYFEKISFEKSRINITKTLSELFSLADPDSSRIISYLALGDLDPVYKKKQFNYSIKSIIKILSSYFNLDNKIIVNKMDNLGDIALVFKYYSQELNIQKDIKELTILDVYNTLKQFQDISGKNSSVFKFDKLLYIFKNLDDLSIYYIVKIISGNMRLGFSDMTIIDSFSWMVQGDKSLSSLIENVYNISPDLGLIAYNLKTYGIKGLDFIKPTISIPIRPAAAQRAESVNSVIEKIGPCIAQPKIDGFRLQIHIEKSLSKNSIYFFSRHLIDISYMFPDLTNFLLDLDVDNIIIEGEAIAFDEKSGKFLPFQDTVKRKRKHSINDILSDIPLRLFIFDILYLNGNNLLNLSHKERRAYLLDVIPKKYEPIINVIDEVYCVSSNEIADYFNDQILNGFEGIILKNINGSYKPGKRSNNWLKLKKVQSGFLNDTLDCVILGYYFGKGRRVEFEIGAFLVGIYNKSKDRFETVAKIGTGLKDKDWIELKNKLDNIVINQKPYNVYCSLELYPDVWVTPSIVVVVLADEITESPLHTALKSESHQGFGLRFPRFISYCYDKDIYQITNEVELESLYKMQFK